MLLSINQNIIDKPADTSGHGTPFKSVDLSVDKFIDHIKKGHAFSAQFAGERRKNENFFASGILAVDIDHGMTLQEAMNLPYVTNFASFIYTTSSHTKKENRFRIVFELEEAIADGAEYRAALTSLIHKFGGDQACKDAARMFYGNRAADVHKFNRKLPPQEVEALVFRVERQSSEVNGLRTAGTATTRTIATFDRNQLVKKGDGTYVDLAKIDCKGNRAIHCPMHVDKNPSAIAVFSATGAVGIYCAACNQTMWPQGYIDLEFDICSKYAEEAQSAFEGWDKEDCEAPIPLAQPHIASDGTKVFLYDRKYLPSLSIRPGTTYIKSPKGSGKTEQLAKIVKDLREGGKTILLVGHRRLLLKNLANRLGLPFYLAKDAREKLASEGCIAVSLESLPKYISPSEHKFDAVILDESEQVISHFISDTLSLARNHIHLLLAHLVKQATYNVFSDADVGLFTSGFVFLTFAKNHPDHLFLNTFKRSAVTSTMSVYSDLLTLFSKLEQDVQSGKRCFVTTNSKRQADEIEANIKQRHAEKSVLLITSGTSESTDVKDFINSPKTAAIKYDVIISSPALSTGVDISFEKNATLIDSVFGIFYGEITTHFEMDQQISRVRDPGEVSVWISPRKASLECDAHVVLDEMMRNRDASEKITGYTSTGEAIYSDDGMLELIAWIISVRRLSMSNLKDNFLRLKSDNGWKIVQAAGTKSIIWKDALTMGVTEIDRICNARDLSDSESIWIDTYAASPTIGLDVERIAMKRKREIKERYGVLSVTRKLVELDGDSMFETKANNLRCLLYPKDYLRNIDITVQTSPYMSSFDWDKGLLKRDLIESLLKDAGLYGANAGLDLATEVSASSLAKFVKTARRRKDDMRSLLDVKIRSDIQAKPVLQLRSVLGCIGLDLSEKRRVRVGGVSTDYYKIDHEHLAAVVNALEMETRIHEISTAR